jgi:hypothetical protein
MKLIVVCLLGALACSFAANQKVTVEFWSEAM